MDQLSGDDIARLGYLALLGTAVAGWFFAQNRNNLGKTAQQALIWALIFIGAIAVAGLWPHIRQTVAPSQMSISTGEIALPRQSDGHYYLIAAVNGVLVEFVVDTGASQIVLTRKDALRVGIDPDSLAYIGTAMTANGPVHTAAVWLEEFTVEDVTDTGVRAVVNESPMERSLLGMTYLGRFARIEIADDTLILRR